MHGQVRGDAQRVRACQAEHIGALAAKWLRPAQLHAHRAVGPRPRPAHVLPCTTGLSLVSQCRVGYGAVGSTRMMLHPQCPCLAHMPHATCSRRVSVRESRAATWQVPLDCSCKTGRPEQPQLFDAAWGHGHHAAMPGNLTLKLTTRCLDPRPPRTRRMGVPRRRSRRRNSRVSPDKGYLSVTCTIPPVPPFIYAVAWPFHSPAHIPPRMQGDPTLLALKQLPWTRPCLQALLGKDCLATWETQAQKSSSLATESQRLWLLLLKPPAR